MTRYLWSVFTKPWAGLPGNELGRLVAGLGFTGAEIPVRDTAYVTPASAEAELPKFVGQLRAEGVEPISIASELSESVFSACAEAGVPLIRIMAPLGDDGYAASVRRTRERLEEVAGFAEQYGVQVGVQQHHGRFVASSLGVLQLLNGLPRERFRVIWDAAHDILAGDDPAVTLPLVADRLAMVNLKNVIYTRTDATGDIGGAWKPWFVQATDGLANWSAVFRQLAAQNYTGPICLTGQYSDLSVSVEDRLEQDLRAARSSC
ncbi:sugar phosphate isomerase/epimerase [Kribbella voronezhensis]|uniref:Sugar phosphate isomerase/epimerase n=1 Tax=Kribbella voronezhensis TaxID=2512212 RepID=A0A4R7SZE6_9ACTN|nr:sugar phosphate isomerase/epimerase family protein [Kribbella voronezhensis]TDU84299.1 sugar phosphate isomerase/epimerase [Kribbella voronezhensis]